MKTILVTGAGGFIGKNLTAALSRIQDIKVYTYDVGNDPEELIRFAIDSDIIFHLAGVNRPKNEDEFASGNTGLTEKLVDSLIEAGKAPILVLSSSIQASMENPYGKSKKGAEDAVARYSERTGSRIYLFRLPNVFGKWCRPNYNSVVATFCYNISHGLDINITDPKKELSLVYIDDVVKTFAGIITEEAGPTAYQGGKEQACNTNGFLPVLGADGFYGISRVFHTNLGELADRLYQIRDIRKTLLLPDLADEFTKCLHATYISYLDQKELAYAADMKTDARGSLFELVRSENMGQIFISRSYKNITRGNHYHDSKVEKFCLIQGEAVIRLRNILSDEVVSYHVSEKQVEIVDIPPGYTHSIENVGDGEMIVIFWSSRLFDQNDPDTYYEKV